MSEESTPIPLREPEEMLVEMTYDAPNILLSATAQGGIITHSVREGRPKQVPLKTRIEWADRPVDEHEEVFQIRAQNQIRFAGQRISVLNDATEVDDMKLPASAPSASEYLDKVGQWVLHRFQCVREPAESKRCGRDVYKIVRNLIQLP